MKLFLDTANLQDIETALKAGFVRGITTNPSLLAKEPKGNYVVHMKRIVALIEKYQPGISLSVEVFTNGQEEMVEQAKEFVQQIGYRNLAIKIPISYQGQSNLNVVRELAKAGVTVNCTACMTPLQLMLAAAAGARYVSLFYNRVRDGAVDEAKQEVRDTMQARGDVEASDWDPNAVLRDTRALLVDYPQAEIIVGSIRSPLDVKQAGINGGHIVTASLKILNQSLSHFKTDDAIDGFLKDFAAWIKS